ncbi:Fe-S-containing protein [Fusobacterium pseudoperiodonticum]|uniref:Fe-S-containing protein n=1 Tax=Fusobacterium pseudoperiodonticum TaxID=2663009 RepID=UPI0028E5A098|nr:Fe-S-containing protein [Fusobacterium pseudoperiodonticum]
MLKFYIDVINYLAIFAFLLGIITALLVKYKKLYLNIVVGLVSLVGLACSVTMTVFKQLYPQKMVKISLQYNRWALAIGMLFMLVALVLQIIKTFRKCENDKLCIASAISIIFSTVAVWFLGFTIIPQVYALTKEFVAFGENSFGTQSLLRLGGFLLGLLTIFLIALSVQKVYFRLKPCLAKVFALAIFFVGSIDFFLRGVSALARLRFLRASNPFVFNVMILEDKSTTYITILFAIVAVIFSFLLFKDSRKVVGTFKNNALLRLEKARLKNNKHWLSSLAFFSILSVFAITVIHSHITKPVALTPPQPYQEEGNMIVIPLTDVEDGHLHRFSYTATGGNNVRFIVVKKPKGGSYGIGLDACDICGLAGYYERNDEVVCKRCDVVMNKSTIGFKGGCNPVPFEYEIKDKKIYIDKATLEKEKDRFPVGD